MRRILCLFVLALAGAAHAQVPPDLTPVKCAWSSFTPQQQERLRNAFSIDNTAEDYTYYRHQRPTDAETAAAIQACRLAYSAAQRDELSGALGYKAREEVARMGLAARGMVKAHIVDRAMGNMKDERRAEIGDRFACPQGGSMDRTWDRSLISAIRRTGTKTVDGPSVAFVGLAMYSIMAQEGYMRRILGANPPCLPSKE